MAFGRERIRSNRALTSRAFLTVAALFAAAHFTTPARAQEVIEPAGVAALDGIDLGSTNQLGSFTNSEILPGSSRQYNFNGTRRTETDPASLDNEIVVTASNNRQIEIAPHPDFTESVFDRAGITTNENPENAGLEPFHISREDMEGWRGVDVPLFNLSDSITFEAQVKRGAGVAIIWEF